MLQVFESKESNCHSITQIHTDVLKNFGLILKCASLWLKRDEIYTENAKSGFSRAHRRFVKTQRMWQEVEELICYFLIKKPRGTICYFKFVISNLYNLLFQNFGLILKCASLWLKRDEIYTENAKSGFSRAHRRFVKTQRMWQEVEELICYFLIKKPRGTICYFKLQTKEILELSIYVDIWEIKIMHMV